MVNFQEFKTNKIGYLIVEEPGNGKHALKGHKYKNNIVIDKIKVAYNGNREQSSTMSLLFLHFELTA